MKPALYTLLFAFSIPILFQACKKEETCSQPRVTQENIQGKWTHRYPTDLQPDFTQPDNYRHVQFVQDSFYLEVQFTTDAIVPNCGTTEYMKGTFKIEDAILQLDGVYTEADYSVKTSPCNHTGTFTRSFEANFCDDVLHLYRPELASSPDRYKHVPLVQE